LRSQEISRKGAKGAKTAKKPYLFIFADSAPFAPLREKIVRTEDSAKMRGQ